MPALDRCVRKYREHGTCTSRVFNSGRPSAFNDDQFSLLDEWIVWQPFQGIPVVRIDGQTFAKKQFGTHVTKGTVGNNFGEAGLTALEIKSPQCWPE